MCAFNWIPTLYLFIRITLTLFAFIEIQIPSSPRGWRGVWDVNSPIGEWVQWNPALRRSIHNGHFIFPDKKIVNPAFRTLVTCALSIYFVTIVLIADVVLSQKNDDRFPSVHSILLLKNSSKIAWHVWSPSFFPWLTLVMKSLKKVFCLPLHKCDLPGIMLRPLVLPVFLFACFSLNINKSCVQEVFFWEPAKTLTPR